MERDSKGHFKKGAKSWNTGKKGWTKGTNAGFQKGAKNPMKNDVIINKVKLALSTRCKRRTIYNAKITSTIHREVERILGKPKKCENCGDTTKNKYDWANISGEYKDDITDYIRLCISCHRLYDFGKINVKRNFII